MELNNSNTFIINDYESWLSHLTRLNIRGLLLTTENKLLSKLLEYIQLTNKNNRYSVLDFSEVTENTSSDKVEHYLGSERNIVIYNATNNFDPNQFAAITGSLTGGGVIILKLNQTDFNLPLANFPNEQNSENSLLINDISCPVLERVIRFSQFNLSTAYINNESFFYQKKLSYISETKVDFSEQKSLIEKIKHVATGHANRPLVLTANRGRGKSAALGIAAAELINLKTINIIITAPQIKNLISFYKHLIKNIKSHNIALENFHFDKTIVNQINNLKKLIFDNGSTLSFIAIDEIIKNSPSANLMIIDEAAAIPVDQLNKISHSYNRIVFSSTSDGYEGNGKGFEIRFKKQLLNLKPQTIFTTIDQPIRWSINDELESSCFKALILKSDIKKNIIGSDKEKIIESLKSNHSSKLDLNTESTSSSNSISTLQTNSNLNLKFELVSKNILIKNDKEIETIFSLLINAHYQTRPSDLKILLSDPLVDVFVVRYKSDIISVSLIKNEGQLDKEIINKINDSQRRLKGDLLPQSIISNFGLIDAAEKKYFRIMRIATHPEMQNLGIASFLISQLIDHAKNHSLDFIGTSFSANSDVVNFWLKNKFECIRFGSSKDSSSGNHCAEMLIALNNQSCKSLSLLVNRFNESFLFKLNYEFKDLDLNILSCILLKQLDFSKTALNDYEINELKKYTMGHRTFAAVNWLLLKLVKYNLANIGHLNLITTNELKFLIATLIKQMDFSDIAKLFKLTGKKQINNWLKEITVKLLCFNNDIEKNTQI